MALDLEKWNLSQTRTSTELPKKDLLKECTKEDDTALELFSWSEKIESLGTWLSIIWAALGLLLSCAVGASSSDAGFLTFLISFAGYLLAAIAIYGSSKCLSLLLAGLSKTVQHALNAWHLSELQARQSMAEREDSPEQP